ncbi:ECF transporter S component [Mycoplasma phocoeninasale]|uniref:ECF transporter S component n=1 Tax=Mycoplasma phocoeninasale TaxID=2726117 RepID=A0A858U6U5_9MOLU|nr:ECF transporter S component [Mycoplasma phocoeninasale]MBN0970955.1 ECF transporter S component [Mycoplasma phocoeninasale]QJG66508.1 ECF transporter S component [Mycoplasma phocoeninasale]
MESRIPGGIKHYLKWVRSQSNISYRKWNSKRIAFVGVLIAVSVVFFIISVRILPISALPSFKFSFIGLPIKITGFIFGPIVGLITGVLADLISFALIPTYYNFLYTLAVATAGFIPGLIAYYFFNINEIFFSRNYRIYKFKEIVEYFKVQYSEALVRGNSEDLQYFSEKIAFYEVKIILLENKKKPTAMINFSFVSTLIMLGLQILIILVIFAKLDNSVFEHNRLVKSKQFYIFLTSSGFVLMGLFVILYRVFLKKKYQTFIEVMAIISFCAILEFINVILLALADAQTLKTDFWVNMTAQTLLSPIKIFFNLGIILATYKIVAPLVKSKEGDRF